ncbi:MAG: CCDC90 family protein [Desulfovibrio sp.]|nr:CCDC90 family protein [Desulfovibrio sp.]
MTAATFDAIGYAKKLEGAGFTREQAEVQAEGLRAILDDRVVTRYLDMRLREMELRLKYDLTIRLGGIVVACTAILLAALPLILK